MAMGQSYTEHLRRLAEAKQKKASEQVKLQQQRLKQESESQKIELEREKLRIENRKADADIRHKDSQSQNIQGKTLIEQEQAIRGEADGSGDTAPKKKGSSFYPDSLGDLEQTPVAPTPGEVEAYEGQFGAEPPSGEAPPATSGLPSVEDVSALGGAAPSGEAPGVAPPPKLSSFKDDKGMREIFSNYYPQILKDRQKRFQNWKKQTDDYRKQWVDLQNEVQSRASYAKKKLNEFHERTQELRDNVPTRNQALNNISWGSRIGAIIHAGLQGYLKGTGTVASNAPLLITQMIENEYNDLVNKYEAEKDSIKGSQNLFQMNMGIENDMLVSKSQTMLQLRQFAIDEYQMQLDNMDQKSSLKIEAERGLHALKKQQHDEQNQLSQWYYEKGPGAPRKGGGDALKNILAINRDQRQASDSNLKLRKFKVDNVMAVKGPDGKDHEIDLPKTSKSALIETHENSKKMIYNTKHMANIVKGIGPIGALAAPFAKWTAGVVGKKTAMKLEELSKLGQAFKMEARVDMTGGGNMAVAEHAIMDKFFSIIQSDGLLKGAAFLMKKAQGDYKVLEGMLKRRAVLNLYAKRWAQKGYRDVWKNNRRGAFIRSARDLGFKENEMGTYFQGK